MRASRKDPSTPHPALSRRGRGGSLKLSRTDRHPPQASEKVMKKSPLPQRERAGAGGRRVSPILRPPALRPPPWTPPPIPSPSPAHDRPPPPAAARQGQEESQPQGRHRQPRLPQGAG